MHDVLLCGIMFPYPARVKHDYVHPRDIYVCMLPRSYSLVSITRIRMQQEEATCLFRRGCP